jgi:hypothetical protein
VVAEATKFKGLVCGQTVAVRDMAMIQDSRAQVAAGGFGDIWKGLVYGQTVAAVKVAVKVMPIFQHSDVEASDLRTRGSWIALKVFLFTSKPSLY